MYGSKRRYRNRPRRYASKVRSVGKKRSYPMVKARRYTVPKTIALRGKWENPLRQRGLFKLRYADTDFDMSTTAGASYRTTYAFAGNGLYDPDTTGVGVQPYGYDQITTLFNIYRVYASQIKVRFFCEEATPKLVVTVFPAISTPTYLDPSDLRVMPLARQHVISNQEGINRGNFLKQYCSTYTLLRESSKDRDAQGATSSNPTAIWYWCVVADTSDTTGEITCSMDVQITYYVQLTKNMNVNES